MKNKTELINEIENIPKFVLKEVSSKNDNLWVEDKCKRVITEENKTFILTLVSDKYKVVQFEETYLPIVNSFEELEGFLRYYYGKGVLVVYPKKEGFRYENDDFKGDIGLLITNSVDKSSAICLKFVIGYEGYTIVIPEKNGFKALHLGNVKKITENYENFIIKVKECWKVILEKLKNRYLDEEEVKNLFKELKLTKKIRKSIKEDVTDNNLWDLFVCIVKRISDKNYRNKVNQINKLEHISKICYKYALVEAI